MDAPEVRPTTAPTGWQWPAWPAAPAPAATPSLDGLRERLSGTVAALLVQATIALLGVLPRLPDLEARITRSPYDYTPSIEFWTEFAVVAIVAAIVISAAQGARVAVGDLPIAVRLVLLIAFVGLPAIAILLGSVDLLRQAATYGSAAAFATGIRIAFFAAIFFGLPLVAVLAPNGPRSNESK